MERFAAAFILALIFGVLAARQPVQAADPPPAVQQVPPTAAEAILGRNVIDATGKPIGRLIDILVDAGGQPEAAVIEFGGFMGVGNRKVAVHWSTLRFNPADDKRGILLEMTPDQIKAAPEYRSPNKPAQVVTPAAPPAEAHVAGSPPPAPANPVAAPPDHTAPGQASQSQTPATHLTPSEATPAQANPAKGAQNQTTPGQAPEAQATSTQGSQSETTPAQATPVQAAPTQAPPTQPDHAETKSPPGAPAAPPQPASPQPAPPQSGAKP